MPEEHWAEIPGTRVTYEASDQGRVRRTKGSEVMVYNGTANAAGYITVSIYKKNLYVHRLVKLAFHGPSDQPLVRHLDGNPANNTLTNLEYGTDTDTDNASDTVRHGRNRNAAKTHCKYGHPFNQENTRQWIGASGRPNRQCIPCHKKLLERIRDEAKNA